MTSRRSPERRIVVGTDGSEAARPALVWALEAAAATEAVLDVVHAWKVPRVRWDRQSGSSLSEADDARRAGLILDREIDAARAFTAARPQIRGVTRHGGAAPVLLDHSATADLLVVGVGGSGGRGATGIGPVTSRCLQRSPIPVAVVPTGVPKGARHWRSSTLAPFVAEIGVLAAMNPGAGEAVHELTGLTRHPSALLDTPASDGPIRSGAVRSSRETA